jgi:hypothetical protein
MTVRPSPFSHPQPGLRIKEGAPPLTRPTSEEIAAFPKEAEELVASAWDVQKTFLNSNGYDLEWASGRHILIAGGTGSGIGCSMAVALLKASQASSLTVLAKDLTRSLNYETGKVLKRTAEAAGWGNRFGWIPEGMALEGPALQILLARLREINAQHLVYINTVAAALSGLQEGMPPVYIKDVDAEGLFQWKLKHLSEKEIGLTRYVMGEMAVKFSDLLETQGISVGISVFADWRGSRDVASRHPDSEVYGRQGAYSTSLYLPKDVIHQSVSQAWGGSHKKIDVFLPIMRTRALPFIPGGSFMAQVYHRLMELEDIRPIQIPELALQMLETIGHQLTAPLVNPFPRLDVHEIKVDEWFFELAAKLDDTPSSPTYFKRWI